MLLTVGKSSTVPARVYGWGADARDLPENADAYGPHVMDEAEEQALAKALQEAGWLPSWSLKATERVVFLCDPAGKWRQSLSTRSAKGQTLQVVEKPAIPTPPVTPPAERPKAKK